MRLLVAYPNPWSASETFIRDQVEQLHAEWQLTGGWYPYQVVGNGTIGGLFSVELVRRGLRAISANLYERAYDRHLEHWLRRHRPEVVLAQYGLTGARMIAAALRAGVPLVVHFHGFDASDYSVLEGEAARYQRLFTDAKAIVVVSRVMAEMLIGMGAPPEKLWVNSCGVDLERFTPIEAGTNPPVLVSTIRLAPKKDPLLMLEAFAQVVQQVPEARLEVIGDGPLRAEVEAKIQSLGLGDSVRLWGAVPSAVVAEVLRGARAYVQHSRRAPNGDMEGLPVALLEAAATGLPIVSTHHAGIPEIVVESQTGALVNEGDANGMIAPLVQLLRDPALATRWGQAGRKHVAQHFDQRQQIARLASILQQAAAH